MSHSLSRIAATLLLAVALAVPAVAHELKVFASQQAIAEPGTKSTVYLSWGHRVPVDDLIDVASVERYDLIAPDGTASALKAADVGLHTNSVELKRV